MSMYETEIERQFKKAIQRDMFTRLYCGGSKVLLFRADKFNAGVKQAIGHCLTVHAMDTGALNEDTRAVVVAGAGNTVLAVRHELNLMHDINVIAVVYEETSERARRLLRKKGIEIHQASSRALGRVGRASAAEALCAENHGYVLLDQHEQPLIVDIQRRTFGRAIVEELGIDQATHFVAGVGTGGTLFGIGAALREAYPNVEIVGLEGVGSTLSLWHAYLRAKGKGYHAEKVAIKTALQAYRNAGMVTKLTCNPENPPDAWFDIKIDFPEHDDDDAPLRTVVGIEGLGVGDPTQLILDNLLSVSRVQIITDGEALEGRDVLSKHCKTHVVESAGANFFAVMRIAEELQRRGEHGFIVSVVTGSNPYAAQDGEDMSWDFGGH